MIPKDIHSQAYRVGEQMCLGLSLYSKKEENKHTWRKVLYALQNLATFKANVTNAYDLYPLKVLDEFTSLIAKEET